jgi:hypothetical protein
MSRLFLLDMHLLHPHLAILQNGCEVGVGAEQSFGLLYKKCGTSAHKYGNQRATNKHADVKTHSATDHVQHIMTARNRPNAPPACSKR